MMVFSIPFVVVLVILAPANCSDSSKAQAQAVSKAHFEFGLDLYKSLLSIQEVDNVLISPYTINTLLSMLFMGTLHSSNSSMQLRSLMHFNGISYVDIHNQFKKIVENFDGNYYLSKMKAAQGLYVASDVTIAPPFDRALRQFYQAKVEHMDFRNADSDQTLGIINEYVSEITEIQHMLETRPDSETRLLMFDAMALTSRWLYPFDASQTFDKGLFYLSDDQRLEVPMMSGKFKLPLGYSQDLECRVLEMRFSLQRISMFILLPDDPKGGMANLEANLTTYNIKNLFSTLRDETVNVKLPKFKMSGSFDLLDSLKKLGLKDLIDGDTADLGLMAPTDTLRLSSFNHKSTFEVTEGTPVMDNKDSTVPKSNASSFDEKHFEVDHSFLFLVWDYYSGMLLLMGRVVNPLSG